MTLFHTAQTPPSTLGPETIVKEKWLSRWLNILIFLVMTLGAAGGGLTLVYLWFTDLFPQELGGVDVFFGLLFCLMFGLVGYAMLWASLQRSNWLLRIRPQELVFKFRSDMNARLPEPHPVVVVLAYSQISWARKTREWVRHYSLNASDGPSEYRAYFLDLKLQLSTEELEQLRQAIDTEIRYEPGAGSPSLFRHYPARLDGDVLRVQWWRTLRPKLDVTIEMLQRHVHVERALDLSVDFTQAISPTEAKQQVLELARRGEQLAAIGLARRFHGLSLSAAKVFVEDLKVG
jgi:hypothetical protein